MLQKLIDGKDLSLEEAAQVVIVPELLIYKLRQALLPHCDGVIMGSTVIKSLMKDNSKYQNTLQLVRNLKSGLID